MSSGSCLATVLRNRVISRRLRFLLHLGQFHQVQSTPARAFPSTKAATEELPADCCCQTWCWLGSRRSRLAACRANPLCVLRRPGIRDDNRENRAAGHHQPNDSTINHRKLPRFSGAVPIPIRSGDLQIRFERTLTLGGAERHLSVNTVQVTSGSARFEALLDSFKARQRRPR